MPRLKDRIPKYRKHRASGQAVVTLDGRVLYLGPHRSKVSRIEYDRVISEWMANGRRLPGRSSSDLLISELIAEYWEFAKGYYRKRGKMTQEVTTIRAALRPLLHLYGHTLAREFAPLALKAVRQQMIQLGWCRTSINSQIGRIRRMIKWAVENERIPPSVLHGLQAVAGLRKGRQAAVRESDPVRPVSEESVRAVLRYLPAPVGAMVELQWLTGMRPGEVVLIRGCDLETRKDPWIYSPQTHKTEHHGIPRLIPLGPKARQIVRRSLKADLTAFLFSPAEAVEAQLAERSANRKTPRWRSHMERNQRKRKAGRKHGPTDHYSPGSYRRAIHRACETVGITPWSPNQLRHAAATRIRHEHGLDAARAVLGHRTPVTTEIYAELDEKLATEIMEKLG